MLSFSTRNSCSCTHALPDKTSYYWTTQTHAAQKSIVADSATRVNVNMYLRSISKIDDYNMVSGYLPIQRKTKIQQQQSNNHNTYSQIYTQCAPPTPKTQTQKNQLNLVCFSVNKKITMKSTNKVYVRWLLLFVVCSVICGVCGVYHSLSLFTYVQKWSFKF